MGNFPQDNPLRDVDVNDNDDDDDEGEESASSRRRSPVDIAPGLAYAVDACRDCDADIETTRSRQNQRLNFR